MAHALSRNNDAEMMTYLTDEAQRRSAINYIRQQLDSGHTLARLLLENADLHMTAVAVLNAVPLDTEQIVEFKCGHVPPAPESAQCITIQGQPFLAYPKANSYEQLAEVIYSFLDDPECVCLLENMLARPRDPWLKRAKSRVTTHGTEVYHILDTTDRSKEKIEDALREAESLPVFVGAILRQPPDNISGDTGHATISTEQLRTFAKSARCLFVGAYDGEGYLVWQAGESDLLTT